MKKNIEITSQNVLKRHHENSKEQKKQILPKKMPILFLPSVGWGHVGQCKLCKKEAEVLVAFNNDFAMGRARGNACTAVIDSSQLTVSVGHGNVAAGGSSKHSSGRPGLDWLAGEQKTMHGPG